MFTNTLAYHIVKIITTVKSCKASTQNIPEIRKTSFDVRLSKIKYRQTLEEKDFDLKR